MKKKMKTYKEVTDDCGIEKEAYSKDYKRKYILTRAYAKDFIRDYFAKTDNSCYPSYIWYRYHNIRFRAVK